MTMLLSTSMETSSERVRNIVEIFVGWLRVGKGVANIFGWRRSLSLSHSLLALNVLEFRR